MKHINKTKEVAQISIGYNTCSKYKLKIQAIQIPNCIVKKLLDSMVNPITPPGL